MNDEKMMDGLREAVGIIIIILAVIVLVVELVAFTALRFAILCSCMLLLIAVELVLNGILKDSKGIIAYGWLYVLYLSYLIMSLSRI